MSQTLELYIMPGCPFCRKVLSYMERHGMSGHFCDITANPSDRSTLQNVGGKVQVPCLFIDGKPLYESDDIIAYLEAHA